MPTFTALVHHPIILSRTTKLTIEQISPSHIFFNATRLKTPTADRVIFLKHKCDFRPVIQNPLLVTHPLQDENELEQEVRIFITLSLQSGWFIKCTPYTCLTLTYLCILLETAHSRGLSGVFQHHPPSQCVAGALHLLVGHPVHHFLRAFITCIVTIYFLSYVLL